MKYDAYWRDKVYGFFQLVQDELAATRHPAAHELLEAMASHICGPSYGPGSPYADGAEFPTAPFPVLRPATRVDQMVGAGYARALAAARDPRPTFNVDVTMPEDRHSIPWSFYW
jgi:hypothetical protein